jgi:RNA polymerase sigma-70 factor (ECF subfamily)
MSFDRAAEGSAAAGDAYLRYRNQVYRYLLKKTRDHHDAEELTQRVFADAAEALATPGRAPDSMLGWLLRVAERRFVDEVRRRETARRKLPFLPAASGRADANYDHEVREALAKAIARLPEDQQVVVVRKVIRGEPFKTIAEDLGLSVGACTMRLSRAVKRLRFELEQEGLGPND